MSREMMLEVRLKDGELTVGDHPVANLQGHWRGPIPPSSGR